jgi:hypothetical protein
MRSRGPADLAASSSSWRPGRIRGDGPGIDHCHDGLALGQHGDPVRRAAAGDPVTDTGKTATSLAPRGDAMALPLAIRAGAPGRAQCRGAPAPAATAEPSGHLVRPPWTSIPGAVSPRSTRWRRLTSSGPSRRMVPPDPPAPGLWHDAARRADHRRAMPASLPLSRNLERLRPTGACEGARRYPVGHADDEAPW